MQMDAHGTTLVIGLPPHGDTVERTVSLADVTGVTLQYHGDISGETEHWSFVLQLARGLPLHCVSSDRFMAMWVVGLRVCLAEDKGTQFSQVRASDACTTSDLSLSLSLSLSLCLIYL